MLHVAAAQGPEASAAGIRVRGCVTANASIAIHLKLQLIDTFTLDEPVRKVLEYDNDTRRVIADPQAPYFGVKVSEKTLVPGPNPRLGSTKFDWWLTHVPPPRKK